MAEQFNTDFIKKSLSLEKFGDPEKIKWLDKSFEYDSDFWQSLCSIHDGFFTTAGKSRPFRQYDFFNDIIFRNINRKNPAFVWYDPVKQWQEISYAELGQNVEQTSLSWLKSGVKPGDVVCIIKQFGKGYLRSLLAGLRLGAVLSFIRPEAKTLMIKQLDALAPDYICIDEIYMSFLSARQDKIINEDDFLFEKNTKPYPSHTYMTGEVAALLFDPICEDIFTPKEVVSDFFFLSGVRDGIIGLGLCPGAMFAAPGFNEVLTQPSFILSVLLNGAAYIHISMKDIEKNSDLLTAYPLNVLGISSKLRDILMEHPVKKSVVQDSWFRDPAESSNIYLWDLFIKKLALDEIPTGCMVWNAAMGGCLMFSRKRKGQACQNLLPMPGRKWELAMMDNPSVEALGGAGLFSVNASLENEIESYIPTPYIMATTHMEYLFAGLNISVKKGMYYPKEFIMEIVQGINLCKDSVMVEIPNINGKMAMGFHLLVFTGHGHKFDPVDLVTNIKAVILSEAGKPFLPDDIKLIPFCPRRGQDNKIDQDWCSLQYLNGGLENKLKNELFVDMSRLRAEVLNLN